MKNVSSKGGAALKVEAKTDAPKRYTQDNLTEDIMARQLYFGELGVHDEHGRNLDGDKYIEIRNTLSSAAREAKYPNGVRGDVPQTKYGVLQNASLNARSKRKARRGGKKGKKGTARRAPELPPTIQTTVSVQHVYRFATLTTTSAVSVTGKTLCGALGCVGAGSVGGVNTVCAFASTAKIHSIKIWNGLSTSGLDSQAEVIWYADELVPNIAKDTSRDSTQPAGIVGKERCLVSRPPKNTLASDWIRLSTAANAQLISISSLKGAVIDVDVSYTLANNYNGQVITTGSLPLVGTLYYLSLDGIGGNLQPVGMGTIN